jgi:hypothetical protein
MYTAYEFTGASFKVGDSEWIPLNCQSIEMDFDEGPPVDTGWRLIGDRLVHTTITADVRWSRVLRLFKSPRHTKIARRKVWRYMEHCGL